MINAAINYAAATTSTDYYYGQGNYDSSTYNGQQTTSTGTGTSTGTSTTASSGGTTSGGALTDTGFYIALIVTLACVIALVAVVVRIWKRPGKAAKA